MKEVVNMLHKHNKLVRDKIPDIINSEKNKKAIFRIMEKDEYLKELNKKLIEESKEFIEKNDVEELADVMEVIISIMKEKNINWEQVEKIRKEKKENRGGFENKVFLESVED